MALRAKRATTIALDDDLNGLLTAGARAEGISRSEFVRRHLRLILDQYRDHPPPRSAGVVKHRLKERGDERELFRAAR